MALVFCSITCFRNRTMTIRQWQWPAFRLLLIYIWRPVKKYFGEWKCNSTG